MHRAHSSSSIFTPTPPMSASSSTSNVSTAQSVFYPQNASACAVPYPLFTHTPVHHPHSSMHEMPQGRIALPMQGGVLDRRFSMSASPNPDHGGLCLPMSTHGTPLHVDTTSPSMGPVPLGYHQHPVMVSPTDEMRQHQSQYHAHQSQRGRPMLVPRHSMPGPSVPLTHRPALQRGSSLQVPPPRSASPHIAGVGDVFDAHASDSPIYGGQPLGITPSRALGPAPSHPISFSQFNNMLTPDAKGVMLHPPSSAMTVMTTTSTEQTVDSEAEQEGSVGRRNYLSSDDEHESPTRVSARLRHADVEPSNSRPLSLARPVKTSSRPTVIGGRTSAKFDKVAEDPGVEGVPEGPRSHERPTPSFACIIGQAILSCKAGGLSLEHIYRYVETAYPFFQKGDGAWRNSVRHNLSIHKMFETIPRTEKYPPGKGGIWIIHEAEKCHWPSRDKFIKNFPPNHPHHHCCRQTLHEAEKERAAREKAELEGKIYVPKKAKKAKKGSAKEEGEGVDMARTSSAQTAESMAFFTPMDPPPTYPLSITPHIVHPPLPTLQEEYEPEEFQPIDFETGEVYVNAEPEQQQPEPEVAEEPISRLTGIAPPRFGSLAAKRRLSIEGDENFFASNVKRARIQEPTPLRPVNAEPEQYLEDSFITPERERPAPASSTVKMTQSSAFKTPALVNTSSSPGSSPMPPTLPRGTHHPSALQQTWTHDDMAEQSTPPPILESAFDIKPKLARRHAIEEEHFTPMAPPPTTTHLVPACPATPNNRPLLPKPVTPSYLINTPKWTRDSPMFPLNEALSTPAWEMRGVIARLGGFESPSTTSRSPKKVAPFSPSRSTSVRTISGSPRKIKDLIS